MNKRRKLPPIKETHIVTYQGKAVSNNKFYSSGHWKVRSMIKDKYNNIFSNILKESEIPQIEVMSLFIYFNSRHDTDNVVAMAKIFVDTLKKQGYIKNDTKSHYIGLCMFPDKELEHNTFEFQINVHVTD